MDHPGARPRALLSRTDPAGLPDDQASRDPVPLRIDSPATGGRGVDRPGSGLGSPPPRRPGPATGGVGRRPVDRVAAPPPALVSPGVSMPDMTPGVASALSPLVRRIVAPNPSLMTGPGTPRITSASSSKRSGCSSPATPS